MDQKKPAKKNPITSCPMVIIVAWLLLIKPNRKEEDMMKLSNISKIQKS